MQDNLSNGGSASPASSSCRFVSDLRVARTGCGAGACGTARYCWRVLLRPWVLRGCAVACGLLSVAVLLGALALIPFSLTSDHERRVMMTPARRAHTDCSTVRQKRLPPRGDRGDCAAL